MKHYAFVEPSAGGFIGYYWKSFFWIGAAIVGGLGLIYLFTGYQWQTNDDPMGGVILGLWVGALIRAIVAGWRPVSEGEQTGCISMILNIGFMAFFWPIAELLWQVRFLFHARSAWSRGEVLVHEKSGKPVRAA